MTSTADLLILGGGIAGLTTALAAAECGLSAIVIDMPRGGSASRAAAGMLAPSTEELPPEFLEPAIAARDYYPDFLARLLELSGVDVPLDRSGILQLASHADADTMRARLPAGAEWLDERALGEHEPAFAGHHPGAVLHPFDGTVDNIVLMDALELALARLPAVHRVVGDVLSIDVEQRSALSHTRGRFSASSIVIATGAWANALSGLPRQLPVRPVRGQLLRLAASPIGRVTYGAGGYLVPRGDTILIGATSEEAGFENDTSLAGLSTLRHIACRAIPSLATALVVDHWAGLRPMSLDSHPILGTDPDARSLVYACGFSRNGILFAPWAADQLVRLIQGEAAPALGPFRLDRPSLATASTLSSVGSLRSTPSSLSQQRRLNGS